MRTDRWIRATAVAVVLILSALEARTPSAQSLGDVARQEAERRNQQAQAGKTYTNEDLDAVAPSEAPPTPAPATEPAPAPITKSSGVVVEENPTKGTLNINAPPAASNRDEKYWRRRSRDLRERLAALKANIAATQKRLTALEAGPQTPAAARERTLTAATLSQLQSDLKLRNDDIAELRTFAESQKVPPAWLELE